MEKFRHNATSRSHGVASSSACFAVQHVHVIHSEGDIVDFTAHFLCSLKDLNKH